MIVEPVFVDRSGRRRRLILAAGVTGTLLLLATVVALLAGFTGVEGAGVPGWPAAGPRPAGPERHPAKPAVSSAGTSLTPAARTVRPTTPAPPSPTTSVSPRPSASPSPSPSVSASTHGKGRGRSASVRPSRKS